MGHIGYGEYALVLAMLADRCDEVESFGDVRETIMMGGSLGRD